MCVQCLVLIQCTCSKHGQSTFWQEIKFLLEYANFYSIYMIVFSTSSSLQWITKFRRQAGELSLLRRTAYLNFISLQCSEVNTLLYQRALELADRLVSFLMDRNREFNRELVYNLHDLAIHVPKGSIYKIQLI